MAINPLDPVQPPVEEPKPPVINPTPAPSGGVVPIPQPPVEPAEIPVPLENVGEQIHEHLEEERDHAKEQLHDQAKEQLKEKSKEFRQQQLEKLKTGKDKLTHEVAGQAKQKAAQAVKKEGAQAVKATGRKAFGQAAKQAGRAAAQAVKQGAKIVAENVARVAAAATSEVWIPVLIILIVIFGVVGALIIFVAYSGSGGKGPATVVASAQQRQDVTTLQALSGSQIANTELLIKTIATEKERLTKAKPTIAKVYASDSAKAAAATSELEAITTSMDAIPKETDVAKRKALIEGVGEQLHAYSLKYPEVLGNGAVNGGYLNVPGVAEAAQGDCGAASVLMVTLYYDPKYQDGEILDRTAHRATKGGSVCVSAEYISAHTPNKDWTRATKDNGNLDAIKRSLAGGDPVVIYGAKGAIFSNSKHIFVVVGYDPSDDTFYVNNPNIGLGNVQVHTKTPNGHQMTSANLSSHLGSTAPDPEGYGHNYVMMIRGKYLK